MEVENGKQIINWKKLISQSLLTFLFPIFAPIMVFLFFFFLFPNIAPADYKFYNSLYEIGVSLILIFHLGSMYKFGSLYDQKIYTNTIKMKRGIAWIYDELIKQYSLLKVQLVILSLAFLFGLGSCFLLYEIIFITLESKNVSLDARLLYFLNPAWWVLGLFTSLFVANVNLRLLKEMLDLNKVG